MTPEPDRPGAADDPRVRNKDAFLDSARAGAALTRELDRLIDGIVDRLAEVDADPLLPDSEIRRAPGRLIVQLGPVALTISWIRSRNDAVPQGRLMVMEWLGTVARGATHVPERALATTTGHTAKVQTEEILVPDATSESDWTWRCEATPGTKSHSAELAERYVNSLRAALTRATASPAT